MYLPVATDVIANEAVAFGQGRQRGGDHGTG
jgi:hypothetical protein